MTSREKEIYLLIKDDPMITQEEIAEQLGISRSAVSVHISSLLRQRALRGRGYVINEEDYHIVIGTAGIDFMGTTERELSDSVTDQIINYYGQINVRFGGAANNIAEALCRLRENVRLMATISSDMFGRQVKEHLDEFHINSDDCLYISDMPQSVMIQIRNETLNQHTGMVNYYSEGRMTPEFFASKKQMLRNARSLVITDIISPESADHLLSAYAELDSWFIFSGVCSRLDVIGKIGCRARHIYLNLRAAAYLTEMPLTAAWEAVGYKLRDLGIREAFVSCDNQEIMHVTPDSCLRYPTIPGTKSDSERNKDLFAAGLIATSGSDMNMEKRIRFASVVSQLGRKTENSPNSFHRELVEQEMARYDGAKKQL